MLKVSVEVWPAGDWRARREIAAMDAVVQSYARLQARFAGRLKDGGANDMWTAACALAQPAPVPVVTDNLSDFQAIAEEFPLTLVHPDL